MERRTHLHEVRLESDGDSSRIFGTAAVTYREGDEGSEYDLAGYGLPGVKERIMPGAFKKALGRSQGGSAQRKADVYAATNHDPSLVFARTTAGTLSVFADEEGLHYTAKPSDTSAGRDAVANAKAGNFGGSSFAFRVAKDGETWRKEGNTEVREIHQIEQIVDVSPVTSPAYRSTTVNSRDAVECRASYEEWRQSMEAEESHQESHQSHRESDQESDQTVEKIEREMRARFAMLTAKSL